MPHIDSQLNANDNSSKKKKSTIITRAKKRKSVMSSNNDCSGNLFLWLIAIRLRYYIIILNSNAIAFSEKKLKQMENPANSAYFTM